MNVLPSFSRSLLPFLVFCLVLTGSSRAQTHHDDEHHHHHHYHHGPQTDLIPPQSKLVTGQGEYIFSWDEELTAAFPDDAIEFEPAMHGGFNEDPETGIIYTGIPGYGLCSISADLKEWKIIGSDPRLKDNIHGIVFFVHKGKKHLAVAQEGKRVLVLNLDGTIISDVLKPKALNLIFPMPIIFSHRRKAILV